MHGTVLGNVQQATNETRGGSEVVCEQRFTSKDSSITVSGEKLAFRFFYQRQTPFRCSFLTRKQNPHHRRLLQNEFSPKENVTTFTVQPKGA